MSPLNVIPANIATRPPHATQFLDRRTLDDYYRDEARKVLGPVETFAERHGWNVRTSYVAGHAVRAIAELAETERPDLVVMGTHGHSALGNVILGSVANGVLARCKVPVLLIR